MVSAGMSVVKYLMFIFNFVFVVCGLALIIIGAVVQSEGKTFITFLGSKFLTAPVILIILGVVIFLIAFLGCWGAIRQNHCMVATFGVLLFLIFIIEIAGGITAFVYKDQLKDGLEKELNNTFIHTRYNETVKVWDDMEHELKCCGVAGKDDYNNVWGVSPPPSCREDKEVYMKGCFDALMEFFRKKSDVVGGVGLGIAVVEVLGMIFAWCLASAIKKELYEGV